MMQVLRHADGLPDCCEVSRRTGLRFHAMVDLVPGGACVIGLAPAVGQARRLKGDVGSPRRLDFL
eukprot:7778732-Lingulodinium_polyedra.AAC.1